ncbi:hypothetical protein [Sphaerothrix gracilis]|uniref:hypothetical protein n=1 Tax=Sphaerothrix gracilis TaxID=3151835 RepID=UPI0031FC2854
MKKLLLMGQCVALLVAVGWSLPAAAGDVPRRFQTCRTTFIQPSSADPASEETPSNAQRIIRRNCFTNIRRFRTGTALCGLTEFGNPQLGEFRQFETVERGRVVRSQPQLVRCL